MNCISVLLKTWLDSMYGMEVPFSDPMAPKESSEESEERIAEAQQRMVLAEKMLAARNSKKQQDAQVRLQFCIKIFQPSIVLTMVVIFLTIFTKGSAAGRKFPLWKSKQEEDAVALEDEVILLVFLPCLDDNDG